MEAFGNLFGFFWFVHSTQAWFQLELYSLERDGFPVFRECEIDVVRWSCAIYVDRVKP